MWGAQLHILDTLPSRLIARHTLVLAAVQLLGNARVRTVEEHLHQTFKCGRIVLHHIRNTLHLLVRQTFCICVSQHLGKSHDDVKRRANLMRHVLDKDGLLALSLLSQQGGLFQFLVAQTRLLAGISYATHVEIQRLQHGGKTVLQPPYDVLAAALGNVYLHVAGSNALRLV